MGEKGNITSDELLTAGSGAVVAGAGTSVTAVFEQAGDTIKDKVLDRAIDGAADAGIDTAREKWQQRGSGSGGSEDTGETPS
jgi:hypothetical protein